ncbi:MAG: hypothetical protein WBA41_22615 [Rivularia sp. (in: cyanobacteria)]
MLNIRISGKNVYIAERSKLVKLKSDTSKWFIQELIPDIVKTAVLFRQNIFVKDGINSIFIFTDNERGGDRLFPRKSMKPFLTKTFD